MFHKNKYKKACVIGIGRSGRAVASLLHRQGYQVLISEEAFIEHVDSFKLPVAIAVETGGHTKAVFESDFIVKSPGILPTSPVLAECKKRKIPVFSELETALAFAPKHLAVFAVTGTNGKTTTTSLLGEILDEHCQREGRGRQTFVSGNIGTPVSTVVEQLRPEDFLVIEVSSYQLEDSTYFRPRYACILNVTPDHLDHHGGMKNYIKAKAKICKNQREKDVLVVNGADAACAEISEKAKSQLLAFSTHPNHLLKTDVFFDGDELIFSEGQQLRPPQLKGIHNVENAMAASLMAFAAGVDTQTVQAVFDRFQAMEHRIEQFAHHHGVIYVNDSKATNVDSTVTALKSFDKSRNIWLILGGRDKGASYTPLIALLKEHCKRVLAIGEAMEKIESELAKDFPVVRCWDLPRAVDYAFENASNGDIVLLSPACSSFDQFKDFEHRGRVFKQLVNARIFAQRMEEK